ncbi:MAG: hypothetical protein K2K28_03440, partial [Clostridia bacterium]|nr:hypothetical protein [Clostridia bacterium]
MKCRTKCPKSINKVLLKYFLLLAVLLTVLVEVVCFIFVKNSMDAQARDRLTHTGGEISTFIKTADEKEISDYLRGYAQDGINVYIVAPDGKVLLPYGVTEGEWNGKIEGVINRLNSVSGGSSVLYVEDSNLNYATAVDYGGGSFMVASYSLKIIRSATKVLLGYFIIAGVVVLLVAVLVSYTISQKLSDGIKNLSTTAVRFSKGDFNANFANAEYKELADLSDTLNSVRDEVKKSGDFQRELLANVSHDLKTPLTMIKAYASMIREISGDNPEKREKHLQVIIDEADRLTGLVNDVLSVSKVNSGLDAINAKVFNLTEFLYGII